MGCLHLSDGTTVQDLVKQIKKTNNFKTFFAFMGGFTALGFGWFLVDFIQTSSWASLLVAIFLLFLTMVFAIEEIHYKNHGKILMKQLKDRSSQA